MSAIRHDFDKLRRLPPYVLAEVTALKHAGRRAGEDIVDLGMGTPDMPTPPHIVEKILETALEPTAHRYSASRGVPNLRAAVCEWYQRNHAVEPMLYLWHVDGTIAGAYTETGRKEYARKAIDLRMQFILDNPVKAKGTLTRIH